MTSDTMTERLAVSPLQRAGAWGVHLYTATGAVTGFAAVLATIAGNYRTAFLWLVAATVVDATDGVLARLARVKERIPEFDGARLDDIVDYLTYVFAPVLLLYHSGSLPENAGVVVAAIVLLSSGYGFASLDAKSDDHFFTGFPSYWNIVAVYLFSAGLPPIANAAILVILSVLVFVRIGYVYPSRTPVLRVLTTILGALWAAMVITIILSIPDVPRPLLIASLFFPVYYTVLSLVLHRRRERARR
jgi:phosphatidylcholine synthase